MGEARDADRAVRRLTGRKVLVIGAGTRTDDDRKAPVGNGRAIAVLATPEGGGVACADVAAEAASATAALAAAEGAYAVAVVGDAREARQSAGRSRGGARVLGGLDTIVVNVGIGPGAGLAPRPILDRAAGPMHGPAAQRRPWRRGRDAWPS